MKDPLVSIACITYNHENYIHHTIEGFLKQKTTFSIEILIYDDASEDGAQEIIKSYAKKDSRIITYLQKENQWSKGKNGLLEFLFPKSKGKYIALCEGDDYWIDPYKLQKQVDFLEANPDYVLVHSDGDFNYTETGNIKKKYIKNRIGNPNSIEDTFEAILRSEYPILTCSVMFRNEDIKKLNLNEIAQFKMGDTFIWLELSQLGKFYFFEDSMITRNILIESAAHSKNNAKLLKFKKSGYDLCKYFSEKYPTSESTKSIMHQKFNRVILYFAFLSNNKSEALKAWKMLRKVSGKSIFIKDILHYLGTRNRLFRLFAHGLLIIIKIGRKVI